MSLLQALIRRSHRHPYYHLHNVRGQEYMRRYWIFGQGTDRDRDDRLEHAPIINHPPRSRWVNWIARRVCVRLHHITLSDVGRHLHDHPAWNISIVLRGGYWELIPDKTGSKWPFYAVMIHPRNDGGISVEDQYVSEPCRPRWRGPLSITFRRSTTRHKIILPEGREAVSLFILGRKRQEWGFYRAGTKVHWRDYRQPQSVK